MLAVTTDDGAEAVVWFMTKEPWLTFATELLERESAVQKQLATSLIPAPRSIAVDLGGAHAGAPAHLMSRLDGRRPCV